MGLNMAQIALSYGLTTSTAPSFENIFRMAGAGSANGQTESAMRQAILEAGRQPVQRDTFYRPMASQMDAKETGSTQASPSSSLAVS